MNNIDFFDTIANDNFLEILSYMNVTSLINFMEATSNIPKYNQQAGNELADRLDNMTYDDQLFAEDHEDVFPGDNTQCMTNILFSKDNDENLDIWWTEYHSSYITVERQKVWANDEVCYIYLIFSGRGGNVGEKTIYFDMTTQKPIFSSYHEYYTDESAEYEFFI